MPHLEVPTASGSQVGVIAIDGSTTVPAVIAGGKGSQHRRERRRRGPNRKKLAVPPRRLTPPIPRLSGPVESFQISGLISDSTGFVVGKAGRMRIWTNPGSALTKSIFGIQSSTLALETSDDSQLVSFTFDLTAPHDPTTLFLQIGETNDHFCRDDGNEAPFLIVPNVENGTPAFELAVVGTATLARTNE